MDVDPTHTHALVVGIGRYDAGDLQDLDGPVPDALRFARWLTKDRGVPAQNIRLFLSRTKAASNLEQPVAGIREDGATRHEIDTAIRTHLKDAQKNPAQLLWIFWGGHGVTQRDGSLRLFYADATPVDKHNLDLNGLLRVLRTERYPAAMWARQIFVIDACRNFVSALPWRHGLPTDDYGTADELEDREQFALFAAKAGESAEEEPVGETSAGLLSQDVMELLQQTPANVWPPEMMSLTADLIVRFKQRRASGDVVQTPSFFSYEDWDGNVRTMRPRKTKIVAEPELLVRAAIPKRKELIAALQTLRVFSTPAGRGALMRALQLDDVAWNDVPAELAVAIVDACGGVDWGPAALLDALDSCAPNEIDDFAKQLQHFVPSGAIEWLDLLPLFRLISNGLSVPPKEAELALRRCDNLPPSWVDHFYFRSIAALARRVSDASGTHPLFEFLEECREYFPSNAPMAEFDAWEKKVATALTINLTSIRDRVSRAAQRRNRSGRATSRTAPAPAVLQIKIAPTDPISGSSPSQLDAEVFRVTGWLRGEWLRAKVTQVLPERAVPYGELGAAVLAAVSSGFAEIENSPDPRLPMWVELFLPERLLDSDFDEIMLRKGRTSTTALGRQYPVLTRSYDRFYESDFQFTRADLRRRWPGRPRPLTKAQVAWLCPPQAANTTDESNFGESTLALVALDLKEVPDLRERVLRNLLDSGLPFAVLLRGHKGQTKKTRAQIERQVLKLSPLKWPEHLPTLRGADALACFQCAGVTFFWDNPTSVPPDVNYQLQQPV